MSMWEHGEDGHQGFFGSGSTLWVSHESLAVL